MTLAFPPVLHGSSRAIAAVIDRVDKAAASRSAVLIAAEPGSGREAIAGAIHARSCQGDRPFTKVDCSDPVSRPSLDALFRPSDKPHGRRSAGPHTVDQTSALLSARDGTVLFAALEDMPGSTQERLADVLRDGAVRERGNGIVNLEGRTIATAGPDLVGAVETGRVRQDLIRRFSHIRIDLLPLRHRREDISAIAAALLADACRSVSCTLKTLTAEAEALIAALPWSGNLSELTAFVTEVRERVTGESVTLDDLLGYMQFKNVTPDIVSVGTLRQARATWERDYLLKVLSRYRWQIPSAARALGIQRPNLYRKLRTLRIQIPTPGDRRNR